MFRIAARFGDGHEKVVADTIDDLGEACSRALDFADKAGRSKGDGHEPPRAIHVYREARIEIAVKVIPGGLSPEGG